MYTRQRDSVPAFGKVRVLISCTRRCLSGWSHGSPSLSLRVAFRRCGSKCSITWIGRFVDVFADIVLAYKKIKNEHALVAGLVRNTVAGCWRHSVCQFAGQRYWIVIPKDGKIYQLIRSSFWLVDGQLGSACPIFPVFRGKCVVGLHRTGQGQIIICFVGSLRFVYHAQYRKMTACCCHTIPVHTQRRNQCTILPGFCRRRLMHRSSHAIACLSRPRRPLVRTNLSLREKPRVAGALLCGWPRSLRGVSPRVRHDSVRRCGEHGDVARSRCFGPKYSAEQYGAN